jgi:tail tube protein
MVATLTLPSNLQWVGLKKETSYGTAQAAPDTWVPVDGGSVKFKPNQNTLVDDSFRGLMSADFQQVAGMRYDTLDYTAFVYLDSCYPHFLSILGRPDAVTGSVDPWTHKTSVENGVDNPAAQPISYTLFWFDGVTCWQMAGAQLQTLKTTVKVDENVTLDASWMGMPAVQLGSPPVNTPSTSKPIPSWSCVISVGGSPVNDKSGVTLEYKRDGGAVDVINNTQSPAEIFSGGFSVAVTIDAIYPGGAAAVDLSKYLANTQSALTVKMSPVGDAVHSLTLQHTVIAYDSAEPAGSEKWMTIASAGKALANATDALDSKQSNTQVIFLNAQSAAF